MDLRTDYPYSLLRKGIIKSYPSLKQDLRCDIAVIGAGITGSLIAYHLVKAGANVAIFDRRHVGMGSTAASTGLLQYEIDTPLRELIKMNGYEKAVRSYLLCRQSLFDLEEICLGLKTETTFSRRTSFQYASYKKHVRGLKEECQIRNAIGIPVEWMDESDIRQNFGFEKPAGLFSTEAAEIDAYTFTHILLDHCSGSGMPVYDHTGIVGMNQVKYAVELQTDTGKKITAKKIVVACGYESQKWLKKKVESFSTTYAIISEPQNPATSWYKNALIWETSFPYMYIRFASDKRILVGGKDDDFSNPDKRDQLLPSKSKALENSFQTLFPAIPFRTDFKWAGVFASTKDGLPFIGNTQQYPHIYFALGYGGNGITFSLLAAQIIRDLIYHKRNDDARIFSFDR